jgi:hypothetical protein
LHTIGGTLLGGLLATQAMAGGVNVWEEEIYTDGVTLTDWTGALLDINGDGNADLAIATNGIGPADISRYYLGNGDGTFLAPVLLNEEKSSVIAAADLNGDTLVDLLQARRDFTDNLYFNDGAGGVNGGIDLSAETNRSLSVAFGDLDGDGDLDFVVGTGRPGGSTDPMIPAQVNRFYLNDGTAAFTGGDISPDADVARSIALVDIDADGNLDVVSVSDSTTPHASLICLNEVSAGMGVSFAEEVEFGLPGDQSTKALIGDLDNDGDPDIVQLNFNGISRFFLNQSTPGVVTLSGGTDVSADANGTNGGVLADFDSDGDLDLAVANFRTADPGKTSRNRLYLNQFIGTGIVSFAAGIDISDDEHMSHQLAAADLNGDGHIDIVVGNENDVPDEGFDRRYLNNGTADPFTNVVPIIDSQVALGMATGAPPLEIVLDDLSVTDPDNVYPADFTLTVQTGTNYTFTDNFVTPDGGFVGVLTVPVIVNDGTEDSEAFDLAVAVGAPFFTSTPIEEATEEVAYTYDVTAMDPDGGAVTIAATLLPAWLTLTDNGNGTATLTGTPTQDDVGDHSVSLEVSDGGAVPGVQDFVIAVAGVNDAPSFTSSPVTDATEGTAYTYDVETSDPDGSDTLIITAPTLPAWLQLADNGDGTAALTGTPDAADVGDHPVSLQVSDGTDMDLQDFTITVAAAPAPGNNAPAFTSTAVVDAEEGTTYTYNITVSDADAGDTLAITAPTLPAWLELNDNGDGTAALTGTPAAADVGDHQVSLQVSDGTDAAVQDFTITVEAAAAPPPPPPPPSGGGGGGGSLGLMSLLALCAVGIFRRRRGMV